MHSRLKTLTGAAAALALGSSPIVASAATIASNQTVNPLVAVSMLGTQASAQAVCAGDAGATAAAAAQAPPNCVLPAADAPPPPPVSEGVPPPPPPAGNFGFNPILHGLAVLALLAGLSTLLDDDDDVDTSQSPT